MGFLDRMKKKAQEKMADVPKVAPIRANPFAAPQPPAGAAPVAPTQAAPASPAQAAPTMGGSAAVPAPRQAPAVVPRPAPPVAPRQAAPMAPPPAPMAPPPAPMAPPPMAAPRQTAPMAAPPQASGGGSFVYDGEQFPIPPGWDGLSIEDWFFKLESVRDHLMNVDDEPLAPMMDADGDPLDPEEILLMTKYGFQSGGHWENFRNWGVQNWAQQTGETITNCEFRMSAIARERLTAEKASAMSGAGGPLAPVEGVSCEQWAQMQAQIAGGADPSGLIAASGMDQAKWDRVSAEWMARMQTDTTFTITAVYGAAFAGGGVGQHGGAAAQAAAVGVGGDVGPEPIPFEKFVEISEAQSAAGQRGEDANQLLASFGMSALDWSNVGMYWNKKMSQEMETYHELFTKYSAKYAAQYGDGDGLTNDEREKKILGQLMQMAGSGQAGQIVPFLKDYFPDDAHDNDALHWWLDAACDMCGESGDRARAEQLLYVRYTLQDDQDDPVAEWVQSEMESLF